MERATSDHSIRTCLCQRDNDNKTLILASSITVSKTMIKIITIRIITNSNSNDNNIETSKLLRGVVNITLGNGLDNGETTGIDFIPVSSQADTDLRGSYCKTTFSNPDVVRMYFTCQPKKGKMQKENEKKYKRAHKAKYWTHRRMAAAKTLPSTDPQMASPSWRPRCLSSFLDVVRANVAYLSKQWMMR